MRKFEPTDHSQHISELLAQLFHLETLVQAGNREEILRQVMDMDWHCLADEFELVVARHCYDVEHYARRIIRNLLCPYVQRQDCISLAEHMRLLAGVLEESPSLAADADAEVSATWERQLEGSRLRHRPIREMPPITSLEELRQAAAAKIALGRQLEGRHAGFDAGERVPYAALPDSE